MKTKTTGRFLCVAAALASSVVALAVVSARAEMTTSDSTMQEKTTTVGGAAMYPSKDIISNAVNSQDHTTLVAAVKAADLVATLQGPGPFTVFAPTNAAFEKLPADTVPTLLKPENKATLSSILTYHVLPGYYTAKDLMLFIKNGNGKASISTVQGERLTFTRKKKVITITDSKGGMSHITIPDVLQSNGVIHVVDTVLMP